jgi:broad specificity phosphatase PhoE
MRLVLVRHGESEHASRGIIASHRACLGLTPRGMEQCRQLARRLQVSGEMIDCSVVLVSPAKRAQQTADIMAAVLPNTEFVEDQRLIEIDPGDAEGLHHDAYERRFGMFDLLAEPERAFAPGGESWTQFLTRIRAFQQDLIRQHAGQTILAVAHAGTIVATLLETFSIPWPGTGARFEPTHTALTEWRYDGSWVLETYNDALHLRTDIFSDGA